MTTDRLKELNEMAGKLRKIEELQSQFGLTLKFPEGQGTPTPRSEREAVCFLIAGGNYNPRDETWKKIGELLSEDLAQRAAEARVAFENA